MITLLASIIRSFTPVSLLTGLILAAWAARHGGKVSRAVLIGSAGGLIVGVPIYFLPARGQAFVALRVFLDSAAIVAAVINAGALFLPEDRGKAYRLIQWGWAVFFLAAIAAASMFSFLDVLGEQSLSSVQVMDTELIMNVGSLAVGACLVAFLVPLIFRLAQRSGKRAISGCLLAASTLLIVPWCAEALLGLMRLEVIAIGSGALSFVAKVNKFAIVGSYIQLAMVAGLSLSFLRRRKVFASEELCAMPGPERRKASTGVRLDSLWLRTSAGFITVVLAILLAHDLYASRPPRITRPVRLTPDASGMIKVKMAEVDDGGLHRFSYVTDDGHVVRFLLIKLNTHSGKSRFGVVYDACVMCGDTGYIQKKHEVICLACNVRIFNPSIGKEGGCNPVPLPHSVEGEYIVVSAKELAKGSRHFSHVVSVRVKDPVTGKELDTLKTPNRYEYKGRNYFFESPASQEKFIAAPERYGAQAL